MRRRRAAALVVGLFLVGEEQAWAARGLGATAERSIYVHLPFCRQRCYYCDFPIAVVRSESALEAKTEWYVDLVLREVAALERPAGRLVSCYFGGGTPSLASAAAIGRLTEGIESRLGLAADAEVTLEADPGTFDEAKLAAYIEAGVTRVSLGAQSFADAELAAAGRAHTVSETLAAAALLRRAPLAHGWSIDLISGLPGQTLESWRRTLAAAVAAEPDHVSVYDLQIQSGTLFARWYGRDRPVLFGEVPATTPREPPLPTVDETAEMYVETSRALKAAGYEHYEISSYAKRRRSVHNALYWEPGASWFACGLGATSARGRQTPYPASKRARRPAALPDYEAYVLGRLALDDDDDDDDSVVAAVADDVLTSLRTSTGLPLARVRALAGPAVLAAVLRGASDALDNDLAVVARSPPPNPRTYLRLRDPHGFLLSNTIIASIFHELLH